MLRVTDSDDVKRFMTLNGATFESLCIVEGQYSDSGYFIE